jgi:EmrB/QacA subfamily drug resistance transporter
MIKDFREKFLPMLGLSFVVILVALDQTIVGTALPKIVTELSGFEYYAWVGISYLLTSVITLPIFGRLGDEHGRKPFVLAAIVIFTIASMLCGMATSMLELVVARALQGVGGGMIIATAFASVPDLFQVPRERMKWQVIFSIAYGLASAIGPYIGGYLTQYFGWRWIFFVNGPVGVLGLFFVFFFLPNIRYKLDKPAKTDWLGSFILAVNLTSLLLLFEFLPFLNRLWVTIGCCLIFIVSGFFFIQHSKRIEDPIIPLSVFKSKALQIMFTISLFTGLCMFAVIYYVPLMLQGGFGLSPHDAGIIITPFAVFITVGSIINNRLVLQRLKVNQILQIGILLFLVSISLLSFTSVHSKPAMIMVCMGLGGFGLGFIFSNITLLVQIAADKTQLGSTTAVLLSMRTVGSMLGVALIGVFIYQIYSYQTKQLVEVMQHPQIEQWLSNPEILMSPENQIGLVQHAKELGLNSDELMSQSKKILVKSIHMSQWIVVALGIFIIWLIRQLPPLSILKEDKQTVSSSFRE